MQFAFINETTIRTRSIYFVVVLYARIHQPERDVCVLFPNDDQHYMYIYIYMVTSSGPSTAPLRSLFPRSQKYRCKTTIRPFCLEHPHIRKAQHTQLHTNSNYRTRYKYIGRYIAFCSVASIASTRR